MNKEKGSDVFSYFCLSLINQWFFKAPKLCHKKAGIRTVADIY